MLMLYSQDLNAISTQVCIWLNLFFFVSLILASLQGVTWIRVGLVVKTAYFILDFQIWLRNMEFLIIIINTASDRIT
jgi:hypothetical protein